MGNILGFSAENGGNIRAVVEPLMFMGSWRTAWVRGL